MEDPTSSLSPSPSLCAVRLPLLGKKEEFGTGKRLGGSCVCVRHRIWSRDSSASQLCAAPRPGPSCGRPPAKCSPGRARPERDAYALHSASAFRQQGRVHRPVLPCPALPCPAISDIHHGQAVSADLAPPPHLLVLVLQPAQEKTASEMAAFLTISARIQSTAPSPRLSSPMAATGALLCRARVRSKKKRQQKGLVHAHARGRPAQVEHFAPPPCGARVLSTRDPPPPCTNEPRGGRLFGHRCWSYDSFRSADASSVGEKGSTARSLARRAVALDLRGERFRSSDSPGPRPPRVELVYEVAANALWVPCSQYERPLSQLADRLCRPEPQSPPVGKAYDDWRG